MDTSDTFLPPSDQNLYYNSLQNSESPLPPSIVKNVKKEEEPFCVSCLSCFFDMCLPCGLLCCILGNNK